MAQKLGCHPKASCNGKVDQHRQFQGLTFCATPPNIRPSRLLAQFPNGDLWHWFARTSAVEAVEADLANHAHPVFASPSKSVESVWSVWKVCPNHLEPARRTTSRSISPTSVHPATGLPCRCHGRIRATAVRLLVAQERGHRGLPRGPEALHLAVERTTTAATSPPRGRKQPKPR